jgi:LysM repeat protein
MTDNFDDNTTSNAHVVFSGLVPSRPVADTTAQKLVVPRDPGMLGRTMLATMPILLVGSLAVSMNLTGPIERVEAKTPTGDKAADNKTADPAKTDAAKNTATAVRDAGIASADAEDGEISTAAAPSSYTVVGGDTVSGIAGRYGISTASVLALNGLGWKSTIFPGQVLKLTSGAPTSIVATPTVAAAPAAAASASTTAYTIVSGDSISGIASRFGVSTQAVLDANGLGWSSIIYPGQKLVIPGAAATTTAPAAVVVTPVSSVTPVVAAAPAATPAKAAVAVTPIGTTSGTYRVVSGDTISGIASKFSVTTQAVLDANGLSRTSTIHPGQTIAIPGPTSTAIVGGPITLLTAEGEKNAKTIISVGRSLGVSDYGLVIALATAMQESSMRNIDWGDLDSVGLFQQRPSSGWGTVKQLTTPTYAARLFFGGPSNPNAGNTRGLLDIPGWQSMTVTQAAQAVQISAYPDAYAKWEASARYWLSDLS